MTHHTCDRCGNDCTEGGDLRTQINIDDWKGDKVNQQRRVQIAATITGDGRDFGDDTDIDLCMLCLADIYRELAEEITELHKAARARAKEATR